MKSGAPRGRLAPSARSSCLTLPSTRMSLMPGHGGGHHVESPRRDQPLGEPPHAVVFQVLHQGVVGGERAGPDRGRARSGRSRRAGAPPRRRSAARPGRTAPAARSCPPPRRSASCSPDRAARTARAALTVVLPTPPLPATMVTRAGGTNDCGSTTLPGAGGVRLLLTLRPCTVRLATVTQPARIGESAGQRGGIAKIPSCSRREVGVRYG